MCLKRMALMSGGRSTLNPNAPLFVPAAFRQVEDFSPEWWQLITTSPWYHDYWLSQHQDEDDFYSNEENDIDNVAALLPETFDFDAGDEFSSIEAQLEEFIQFSEAEGDKSYLLPSDRRHEKAGLAMEAETLVQSMKYLEARSPKNQAEPAKYAKKAPKFMTTKYNPQRIQQPR